LKNGSQKLKILLMRNLESWLTLLIPFQFWTFEGSVFDSFSINGLFLSTPKQFLPCISGITFLVLDFDLYFSLIHEGA